MSTTPLGPQLRLTDRIRALPIGLILAIAIGNGIAHVGTSTMPLQIDSLMDGAALTAGNAGLFGFLQVGAFALTMILLSPVIDRFSCRVLALLGTIMMILGSGAIYILPWSMASYGFAIGLGCGFGLVFAATIATVSISPNADRLYAASNGGALVLVFIIVTALPFAANAWHPLGVFMGISIAGLVISPFIMGLSRKRVVSPDSLSKPQGAFSRPGAVPLLIAWVAFSLGTGAVWAFAARMGKSIDIAPETIGIIFSSSIVFGILGTIIAGLTATFKHRIWLLGLGLLASGVSCLMIGLAAGVVLFAAGVVLYWISYMYLYSILLGTAALLDPQGRLGTLGAGSERLAYAVGAWAGGLIAQYINLPTIGWLGAFGSIFAVVVCCPAIGRSLKLHERPLVHNAG